MSPAIQDEITGSYKVISRALMADFGDLHPAYSLRLREIIERELFNAFASGQRSGIAHAREDGHGSDCPSPTRKNADAITGSLQSKKSKKVY